MPYIYFLYLNMKQGPMQDLRVRRPSTWRSTARASPATSMRHRAAEYGMAVAGNLGLRSHLPQLQYDPDKAKKLMGDAGHADGFKTLYHFPEYGTGTLVQSWISATRRSASTWS